MRSTWHRIFSNLSRRQSGSYRGGFGQAQVLSYGGESNTLYEALISAPQIDAVYTSFDDGYHRVVTRMDEDRRRQRPAHSPARQLAL